MILGKLVSMEGLMVGGKGEGKKRGVRGEREEGKRSKDVGRVGERNGEKKDRMSKSQRRKGE